MLRKNVLTFLLLSSAFAQAQILTDTIVQLKAPITESSGLVCINGIFITHNDSDNDPVLYEIDTLTGLPARTVYIQNATNIDWEDIAADAAHLYIGDIGNNQGTRQNLRIYKVALADYWSADTVLADTINYSYADQTGFAPMPFQTNFDAEALIARGDSLYIFTKQWGNAGTRAYKLPKAPGTYSVSVYTALSLSSGLVTGADYLENFQPGINVLALTINQIGSPRTAFYLDNGDVFGNGGVYTFTTAVSGSIQVEAICLTKNHFYCTSEAFGGAPAMLSRAAIPPFMNTVEYTPYMPIALYPNPSKGEFLITLPPHTTVARIQLHTLHGAYLQTIACENASQKITLAQPPGMYQLMVHFTNGTTGYAKLIIK